MAEFCTKCGAGLGPNAGFCPACGTPVGSAAVPPPAAAAPVAAPPVYGQPVGAYPPMPPPRSGGAWKTVLIVVAVVVGLGVLAVGVLGFVGWRAMHNGSISVGQGSDITAADLGVSIYPGAVANANSSVKMKIGNILTVTAMYTTGDPASSVLSFYQDKMGSMTTTQNGRTTTLSSVTVNGNFKESIVVTVTPSAQDGGATKIMIAHTKAETP